VLAVLYFQSLNVADAYVESDVAWLEGYSAAIGRAFGFHFSRERRERELRELLQEEGPENAPELVGESSETTQLRRALHETYIPIVETERPDPILILGERGTGKDLVARYIYAYSRRSKARFVVANCAELTDELAAARFFGHKRGAFTGALTDEPGFFRAAQGGVLFLDEIGDLSLRAQACLLRVLENHVVVPVGETREIPVDVAVILATNRDLDQAAKDQTLRMDFYDRFRTQAFRIAPLRERPWDVPPLSEHFRAHHERRTRKRTLGFTQDVVRALVSYHWPGNVRELARSCSLLVAHAKAGGRIDRELVGRCCPDILTSAPHPKAGPLLWDQLPMRDAVRALQRELILSRLERYESVKAARESLKLNKATFYRYARALKIRTE
jgi:DNA-binding NtrC family response regulator